MSTKTKIIALVVLLALVGGAIYFAPNKLFKGFIKRETKNMERSPVGDPNPSPIPRGITTPKSTSSERVTTVSPDLSIDKIEFVGITSGERRIVRSGGFIIAAPANTYILFVSACNSQGEIEGEVRLDYHINNLQDNNNRWSSAVRSTLSDDGCITANYPLPIDLIDGNSYRIYANVDARHQIEEADESNNDTVIDIQATSN